MVEVTLEKALKKTLVMIFHKQIIADLEKTNLIEAGTLKARN